MISALCYDEHVTETTAGEFPEQFYQDPTGIDRYIVQEKIWAEWTGPTRLHAQFTNQRLRQGAGGILIISAICFIFGELMTPVVLWAGAFLFYLLVKQPSPDQTVKVTTLGIKFDREYVYWQQLSQFWIEERDGHTYLYLRQIFPMVTIQRAIVPPSTDATELKTTIGKYILYKVPDFPRIDRWVREFSQRLPIDVGA
jgi:hypothetical protein